MSDVNRVGVRFGRPSTPGSVGRLFPLTSAQTPTDLDALRITGTPNFGFVPIIVDSNEIRSDRQRNKPKLVGFTAGGSVGFELSPLTFEEIISGVMFSLWTRTQRNQGATDIVSFGAGTVTLNTGLGADYTVGQVVRLDHADANGTVIDGAYEITGIATETLTLAEIDGVSPALTAGLTPNADTIIKVTGFKAQTNADVSLSVSVGVGTLSCPNGLVDDAMGTGSPLVVGQWIKLNGFATAANNVYVRISSVDTGADEITFQAPSGMITDAATTEQVEVFWGDYIRNGIDAVTDHQFVVERRFEDHNPVLREAFTGMAINQLQLTLAPQSIVTGTMEFFGLNALARTEPNVTQIYEGGAPNDVAAPEKDIYNSSTNIGRIATDLDSLIDGNVNFPLATTLTINNNLRRRDAIGFQGAASIGAGEVTVTGNVDTYFDDLSVLQEIQANTTKRFDMAMQGEDGRVTIFDSPSIVYTGGAAETNAKNTDATLPAPFGAFKDAVLGYTIHVQTMHFAQ